MKWLKSRDKKQPKLSLKEQQSIKLAEMGAKLAAARQEKALSIDDVVVLTKIPGRLLKAIEDGNLDDLPESVYVQSFIRQFANTLGWNGVEFSRDFPVAYETITSPLTEKKYSVSLLRPVHLYMLYIAVIFSAVTTLSQWLNDSTITASNQITTQSTGLSEKVNDKTELESISNTSKSAQSAINSESINIGITVKASSWIRVVTDGKMAFEGVLPPGAKRNWNAQEQLMIKTDNAGGVLMSINHEQAKQMGETGKNREIKIAAKPKL